MSEAALAANRANAQKSSGPRQTQAVKFNALKSGFRSSSLVFESEDEQKTYQEFAAQLWEDQQPEGSLEEMLVSEMAVSWWKLQTIDGLLLKQVRSQTEMSQRIYDAFLEAKQQYDGNLIQWEAGLRDLGDSGWQCEQLVFSSGRSDQTDRNSEGPAADPEARTKDNGRLQLRFEDSSERLLRYANAWRRDFYRALGALVALRSEK